MGVFARLQQRLRRPRQPVLTSTGPDDSSSVTNNTPLTVKLLAPVALSLPSYTPPDDGSTTKGVPSPHLLPVPDELVPRPSSPASFFINTTEIPINGLGVLYEPEETTDANGEKRKEARTSKKQRKAAARNTGQVSPIPQKPRKINADIVFVHGLTGSSRDTWLNKDTNTHWPANLLGKDLNDVRILSFGYDANVVNFWNPASQNRINNHAENLLGALARARQNNRADGRAIIFVAHSLGGLVVENALRLSRFSAEEHIRCLEPCVSAIVFLGTPHFGADLANWAKFGINISKIARRPNEDIVSVLRPGSEMLAEVQKGFHIILRLRADEGTSISITCFYEELPLPIFGEVVPKHSAIIPGYSAYGIHANHEDLTKFASIKDPGYQAVLGELRREMKKIRSAFLNKQLFTPRDAKRLQSFYKCDYAAQRQRNNLHTPGTSQWFLKHEQYVEWLKKEESSLLWVSADPGSGKSVLASFLIDELRTSESQAIFPCTVCYFFFKDDNASQRDATVALCAITHQLLDSNHELIQHAHVQQEKKGSRFTDEFLSMWDLLLSAFRDSRCGHVLLVLDALDECEERSRKSLVEALGKIYLETEESLPVDMCLKVIVTSRPYRSIEAGFRTLPTIRLKAENETASINEDIELVVKVKVQELAVSMNIQNMERINVLEKALIAKSDRTFLWVSLVLKMLENSIEGTDEEFQELINHLPADLDATYEKILSRSPKPEKARKILNMVVAAARPLTVKEINIALAIRPGQLSITAIQSNLLPNAESSVKDLCGLFVRVIDSKVYLVHQTAKEFLVNDTVTSSKDDRRWKYSLSWPEANLTLAESCIRYILFHVFENYPLGAHSARSIKNNQFEYTPDAVIEEYGKKHQFLSFSATYWAEHLRQAQVADTSALVTLALRICRTHTQRFDTWLRMGRDAYLFTATASQKAQGDELTDLMVVSYFGLEACVKVLLSKSARINAFNSHGDTALHIAARIGYTSIVEMLLTAKADTEIFNHTAETPLRIAVAENHIDIVLLLVRFGADIQRPNHSGSTPLHVSARCGLYKLSRILLDEGAKVNIKDKWGDAPLHDAARHGYLHCAELLLANDADVNMSNKYKETPLLLAARSHNLDMLLLFAESGAEVNVSTDQGETALHFAARAGNNELVRELLHLGINHAALNSAGQTALHLASQLDDGSTAEILLEKDTGTELLYRQGWTSLHLAAFFGRTETARALLQSGARVAPRNLSGETPLYLAVIEGYDDVVSLLLDWGAKAAEGQDLSELAEEKGYLTIAELLNPVDEGSEDSVSSDSSSDNMPDHLKGLQV